MSSPCDVDTRLVTSKKEQGVLKGDWKHIYCCIIIVFRAFFPKLNDCETDDDVAMCFLKNKEGFEKYLQYQVGQGQAESAISDKIVHHFFKVSPELLYCLLSGQ